MLFRLLLLLLGAALVSAFFESDYVNLKGTDRSMWLKMHERFDPSFKQGLAREHISSPRVVAFGPEWYQSALQHARDKGVLVLGVHSPLTSFTGNKKTYFVTLIHYDDGVVARQLQLHPQSMVGAVLWKHSKGQNKIVSIDRLIRKPEMNWDPEVLESVLQREH